MYSVYSTGNEEHRSTGSTNSGQTYLGFTKTLLGLFFFNWCRVPQASSIYKYFPIHILIRQGTTYLLQYLLNLKTIIVNYIKFP